MNRICSCHKLLLCHCLLLFPWHKYYFLLLITPKSSSFFLWNFRFTMCPIQNKLSCLGEQDSLGRRSQTQRHKRAITCSQSETGSLPGYYQWGRIKSSLCEWGGHQLQKERTSRNIFSHVKISYHPIHKCWGAKLFMDGQLSIIWVSKFICSHK